MKLFISISLFLLIALFISGCESIPKTYYNFKYDNVNATIISGIQYGCDKYDCSDASSLNSSFPLECDSSRLKCSVWYHNYAGYYKLRITFSDKTRESNVFLKNGGDLSDYSVNVLSDTLEVRNQYPSLEFFVIIPGVVSSFFTAKFLISMFLALIAFTLIAYFILKYWNEMSPKYLLYIALLNFLIMCGLWCAVSRIPISILFLLDIFIILAESVIIHFLSAKKLELSKSFLISLVCNVIVLSEIMIFIVYFIP